MLFHGAEGTKIRDITDGTSQTILAVEVAPDHAVEWTKPADWEVDLNDPTRGLKRGDGDSHGGTFAAAYCDGHVETMSIGLSPDVLKARLTKAGGEPIQ
jgi:prepilin-type processing-associated H-X9-DG protein